MEVLNIDFPFFPFCSISEWFIIFFWDISQRQEIALITCSKVTYTDCVFKNLVKKSAVPGHRSINQQERQESILNKRHLSHTEARTQFYFQKTQTSFTRIWMYNILNSIIIIFKSLNRKGNIKHKFQVESSFLHRHLDFANTNFVNFLSSTLYHNAILKKNKSNTT